MKRVSIVAAAVIAVAWGGIWLGTSGGQDVLIRSLPGPGLPAGRGEGEAGKGIDHLLVDGGDYPSHDEANELLRRERDLADSTRQLLQELRKVESEDERAPITRKLASVVEEQFDIRQQVRERELEALETRIQRLRDLHEKRADAKAEIVERRVEQLVRDAEGLGWSSGGSDPGDAWTIPFHAPHPPHAPGVPVPVPPQVQPVQSSAEPSVAR